MATPSNVDAPLDSANVKEDWIKQQLELKSRLILSDQLPWQQSKRTSAECPAAMQAQADADASSSGTVAVCPHGPDHCLRLVAGADLSFQKDDPDNACASLIVLQLPDLRPVYRACRMVPVPHPYMPGFLSFREAPAVMELLGELRAARPDLVPQALVLDGNGTLHPRGFGLACHVGLLAGLPTVGAAKSFFHVDGLDQRAVRQQASDAKISEYYIKGESGATHGCAYFPSDSVHNPVYISCGHMLSLGTAVWLVSRCCRYRVPEPTRLADIESREFLRKLHGEGAKAATANTARKGEGDPA